MIIYAVLLAHYCSVRLLPIVEARQAKYNLSRKSSRRYIYAFVDLRYVSIQMSCIDIIKHKQSGYILQYYTFMHYKLWGGSIKASFRTNYLYIRYL